MERLNHPEYDAEVAERNAHRAELLSRLDLEFADHLARGWRRRRVAARFLRLCRRSW